MGGCGLFTTRLDRAAILMHAFTRSLVHSFAGLLVCAARLFVCAFARLLVCAFVHLLIFAFADSLISLIFYRFLMSSFALLLCKLLHA